MFCIFYIYNYNYYHSYNQNYFYIQNLTLKKYTIIILKSYYCNSFQQFILDLKILFYHYKSFISIISIHISYII